LLYELPQIKLAIENTAKDIKLMMILVNKRVN